MSGGANKRVGSTGEIRVHAQVISQSISRNESVVRVRGFMRAVEGSSTSYGTADMSTSATSGGTRSWPGRSFSIQGSSWQEVVSHDHTVPHRSDGTRPLTATFTLGPTGTSRFGSGGTVSVSFNVDRIPQVPSKPNTPSVSNITSTGSKISWSAPASNGAAIEEYQWEVANSAGSRVDSGNTTARSASHSGRAPNTAYQARVRAKNAAGWGPWSNFRAFTTKVASPAAPNNISASRVNDGRVDIGWSRNSTSAAPYGSQRVLRREYTGTQWSNFTNVSGTLSGSATSFVDTSVQPNGQYQYQVQAINDSGSATSATSGSVRTTPGAPTIGTARKLSSGDIEVTYTPTVPYEDHVQHELQDNPGGTGWVTVATVVGSEPLKHEDPDPTKTHQYRVRTVDTFSSPNLAGSWSGVSNIVQLLAPPLAPSLIGPQGAVDRDEPVLFRWRHNPVDTTDQTEFELEWWLSYQPANPVTVTGGSEQEVSQSPLGSTNSFSWRVRTKGDYAGFNPWSPWSPVWSFDAVSRPEVVIQSPQGTSDQSQVEVEWGYQNADPSAQSRWEAQLLDAEDNVLATGSGSNTATSHLFPTVLEDSTEYTVRVRARAGSGLWSEWDTSTFVTDFPLPYPVEVLPEWDRETGSVSITFQVDDSDATEQAPDSVDVQRDDGDGDGWITIATGLDPETSIVDHTPRLAEIRYRTISRTTLPTARTGPETMIEWEHGSADPVYVNGGPSFEVVCTAIGHEVTDSPDIEQALQEWAGWKKATAVFGTGESYAIQFRGKIFPNLPHLDGRSTLQEWHALQLRRGIVCYRDCQGRKVFGLLGIGFSTSSGVTDFNLSVSEARHVEGVRATLPIPEDVD